MKLLPALLYLASAALLSAQTPGKNVAGSKQASGSTSATADVAKGKKLFDANCAICHYRASSAKKIGPGLKGLSKRGRFADGKGVDDASLRAWIEKGGKDMPGLKDLLRAEEVRELIAYLKTL
jgi:mono/diheme cytochrome c family protein